MKAIILAAGYATRLHPLTLSTPKPLLKVGDRRILDYIYDEVESIPDIDEVFIISNHKFFSQFADWKEEKNTRKQVKIIDDGTTSDENKLGAIGDIALILKEENINDDIMVLAGDIIFTFGLDNFYNYYVDTQKDCICVSEISETGELRRMGVALLDGSNKVMDFEEKPQHPKSKIGVTAFYIYRKDTLPLFREYIRQGNNVDAPGHFIGWLHKKKDVYAYRIQGECYDIGTHDSLREVRELFSART